MNNASFSIRSLITTMIIVLVAVISIIGTAAVYSYQNLLSSSQQTSNTFSQVLSDTYQLRHHYQLQTQEWRLILLRGQDYGQYYTHLKRFYELEKIVRSTIKNQKLLFLEERRLFNLFSNLEEEYKALGKAFRKAIRAYNEADNDPHIIADAMTKNSTNTELAIDNIVKSIEQWRKQKLYQYQQEIDIKNYITSAIYIALTIICLGFILFFVERWIVRPINNATNISTNIQNGNLDNNISTNSFTRETYDLLTALDYMQQQIRQNQNSLLTALNTAEQANKAKDNFLSSMSHELRTPMNSILGFSQLLSLDSSLSEKQKSSIHEILTAGEHLMKLINQVLDLSTIQQGKVRIDAKIINITKLIYETITLLTPLVQAKNIKINCDIDKNKELLVKADPLRIKQVLINLTSNAIKYNRESGTISISDKQSDQNHIRLSITDTGVGIDQSNLEKIFAPFERLGYESGNIEGAGVGLALSREIVLLMDGDIEVQSTITRGSTFTIILKRDP